VTPEGASWRKQPPGKLLCHSSSEKTERTLQQLLQQRDHKVSAFDAAETNSIAIWLHKPGVLQELLAHVSPGHWLVHHASM
jgi:hypothetical protein